MKIHRTSACLLASAFLLLSACESTHYSEADRDPSIRVTASTKNIVAGESVTLTARTADTYGRDAEVRWSSTAGRLETMQEGRVARVRFDEVGTYTVRATLSVDGREVESDLVEVRVKPIN